MKLLLVISKSFIYISVDMVHRFSSYVCGPKNSLLSLLLPNEKITTMGHSFFLGTTQKNQISKRMVPYFLAIALWYAQIYSTNLWKNNWRVRLTVFSDDYYSPSHHVFLLILLIDSSHDYVCPTTFENNY